MPPKTSSFPKFTRPPKALIEVFDLALAPFPDAERRKMFGYPCSFANGYMFAGLFQNYIILKLPEVERTRFLKFNGARQFEPMPGRPMKEYVVVPEGMLKAKTTLKHWLKKAHDYVTSLPPKKKGK